MSHRHRGRLQVTTSAETRKKHVPIVERPVLYRGKEPYAVNLGAGKFVVIAHITAVTCAEGLVRVYTGVGDKYLPTGLTLTQFWKRLGVK